ncbi:MAG: Stk1 family PASTA domain-containing Ser/Thr kinase [Gaiellales bacterium]
MDSMIGQRFDGRYRLERRIGSGGMADVYLAQDETLHRRVAIKILADRYTQDEGFVERFRREATAAAGLNHPNIVSIYDRGQCDGTYYIAMEYLEGTTLKDEINARAPLPEAEAVGYAQQALQALEFAHRRGVIHRDVKPHNMVLTDEGALKVMDFGIARAANRSEMTEVGSIVGTAQYLSPEQARGQTVGPQSDIYSLGVVLYEMLTGELPFKGDSAVEIAMKQVNEKPPRPSSKNRLISPALEQTVMRALAKDPALRFHSAREMSDELERCRRGIAPSADTQQATRIMDAAAATQVLGSGGYGGQPTSVLPPARPPEPKRSSLPWILVGLLLIASMVVGFIVYQQLQSNTAKIPGAVIGLTCQQARNLLAPTFKATCKPRQSRLDQRGTVIATDPSGSAEKGSTVTLFIGSGPAKVTLPPLRGKPLAYALDRISHLGLPQPLITQIPSKFPAGTVAATKPGPGPILPTTVVTLFVANGNTKVPATAGMTCDQAKQTLQAAGFVPGNCTDTSSDTVAKGQVIDTVPPGGSIQPRGASIEIQVSSGPSTVAVPDVVGMTEADARSTLKGDGFKAQTSRCFPTDPTQTDGTVVSQNPSANSPAQPHSVVTIYVADSTQPPGQTCP